MLGGAIATVRFLARRRRGRALEPASRDYRRDLARAIPLGLEFLIAGDPSFRCAAIRTFLSPELELAIEGRWRWQWDGAIGPGQPATGAIGGAADTATGAAEMAAPAEQTKPMADSR